MGCPLPAIETSNKNRATRKPGGDPIITGVKSSWVYWGEISHLQLVGNLTEMDRLIKMLSIFSLPRFVCKIEANMFLFNGVFSWG